MFRVHMKLRYTRHTRAHRTTMGKERRKRRGRERERERADDMRRPSLLHVIMFEAHEQNERWTTVIQSSTSVPYVSWLLSSSCDIVFVHIRPRFPASTIRLPESRQLTRTGTKNIGKNDALNVIIAFTPDIYFPMIFLYDALIEDRH